MFKNRLLPTAIIALAGAVLGSFAMMLYASTHFANVAGPNNTPPALFAAPYTGTSDQDRIVNAVKRVKPSVVAINLVVNGQQRMPFDPFSQFFGGQGSAPVQPYHARASGSGFVYANSGLIVTNAHVVSPPGNATISKLEVVFQNNDRIPAHVVSTNIGADLALIKVDGYPKLPPPLVLADSDKLEQGQWAIAIGEPLQLQQTVTVGVVSGFNRTEPIPDENGGVITFKGLMQTSAPINPGNSGGPLVDVTGRVIGVNQSTASPQSAQGIGFAIPSNIVRTTLASLERNPGVHQGTNAGFIGTVLQDLTPGIRNQLNYSGQGVAIARVSQGSPADNAGLQPGDVILKVNGKNVTTSKDLISTIRATKPGHTVGLQVWSQGVKRLATVRVTERPADAEPVPQQQENP